MLKQQKKNQFLKAYCLFYCRPYEDESSSSSSSESDDEDEGRGGYASEPTGGFSNVSQLCKTKLYLVYI